MENTPLNVEMGKLCPYCGKMIAANAKKCNYCGEWIEKPTEQKSFTTALLLSFFLGWLGVHRFYTGYLGIGIAQVLTLGGCGLWAFIDLLCIAFNNYKDNNGNQLKDYNKVLGTVIAILSIIFSLFAIASEFNDSKTSTTANNAVTTETNYDSAAAKNTEKSQPAAPAPQPVVKPDLELLEHHPCAGDFGTSMVCGTVINNTDHTYGYVQVEINLYDSDGTLVDSTMDNINNLEPHSKWKFKAAILEDNVARYKIKDVNGF